MKLNEFIEKNDFIEETTPFYYEATSKNDRIKIFICDGYSYVNIKIDEEDIVDKEVLINAFNCDISSIEQKLYEAL